MNRRLYIRKDNRVILLKSKSTKEHPALLNLIQNHEKIYFDEINELDVDEELKNLLSYSISKITADASSEWKAEITVRDLEEKRVQCELCGQPNRYMCFITNVYNLNQIHVGSECIKHFSSIDHKAVNKDFSALRKNARKSERKAKINSKIPQLENQIGVFTNKLNHNPYVLPIELETTIHSKLVFVRQMTTDFIDGKQKDSCFDIIQNCMNEILNLFSNIDKFNLHAKDNIFACNKSTKDWLLANNKKTVLEKIQKNQGCINEETITEIYYHSFISKFNHRIEFLFNTEQYKLIGYDGSKVNIQFTYFLKVRSNRKQPYFINIYCSTEVFMKQFGALLLCDAMPINFNLLNYFQITENPSNEIFLLVNDMLRKDKYAINLDEEGFAYLKLNDNDEWSKRVKASASTALRAIKNHLDKNNEDLKRELTKIFSRLKKWQTRQEVRELEQARRNI